MVRFFVGTKRKPQIRFKSFGAISTAAINIIQAFRMLHNGGYSYQDINNGNFFIDPATGKVLICDNDNVSPFGTNLGIMGKQRWMAPEIVTGQSEPDKLSDRFSLAVVLFRLLFINHPLEGNYSTPPCMTKALEKRFYGEEPIFVYDPNDDRNRPIPGADHNLRRFWSVYPQYIRDLFIRAFSHDVMHKLKPRVIEQEWLDAFFRLRAETGKCPYCKEETFYSTTDGNECIECKKKMPKPFAFQFTKYQLPVYPGLKVYLWHLDSSMDDIDTIVGEVITNIKNPKLLGLRNTSANKWQVTLPDGSLRAVEPGNALPIKDGYVVDFFANNKLTATIKL